MNPNTILAAAGLLAAAVMFAGVWRVLEKTGAPGWAALVPGLNVYLLLKAAQIPGWWFFLALFPPVTFFIAAMLAFELAYRFGRGAAVAMGLLFLPMIFYPVLGFGPAQYSAAPVPDALTRSPAMA